MSRIFECILHVITTSQHRAVDTEKNTLRTSFKSRTNLKEIFDLYIHLKKQFYIRFIYTEVEEL